MECDHEAVGFRIIAVQTIFFGEDFENVKNINQIDDKYVLIYTEKQLGQNQ